jgi:hypothetical protein
MNYVAPRIAAQTVEAVIGVVLKYVYDQDSELRQQLEDMMRVRQDKIDLKIAMILKIAASIGMFLLVCLAAVGYTLWFICVFSLFRLCCA